MTFFLDWQLWQQMTFGLGAAIVLVFTAGLIKLWWITRRTRKYAIVDQEKRARLEDMRRTGLATKPGLDIPFGVRAIQSGIEIEGIWISRPNTPVGTPLATPLTSTFPSDVHGSQGPSSTTLIGDASSSEYGNDKKGKGREDASSGPDASNISSSASTSSSDGERDNRNDTYRPKGAQGDGRSRTVDTYVPSNAYGSQPSSQAVPLRPLTTSRTNSPTTANFPALTPQAPSGRRTPQQQYSGRHSPTRDNPSPRGTPILGPMNDRNNAVSDLDLRQPSRTFGPGDVHNNRSGGQRSPPRSAGRYSPNSPGPNKLQKAPPGGYL